MKIFLDSSNLDEIREASLNQLIQGFTTNPSLMFKAGISDYEGFCKEVLRVTNKPVSFEVFADSFEEVEYQARLIASWAENIYIKIPITNTKQESHVSLINKLTKEIKINITAVTNPVQCKNIFPVAPMIISVFSGRIADTGRDPKNFFEYKKKFVEYLWASSREVLNIYQAEKAGADIITCTSDLIKKYIKFKNMDLDQLSLMTVRQFHEDALASGFRL